MTFWTRYRNQDVVPKHFERKAMKREHGLLSAPPSHVCSVPPQRKAKYSENKLKTLKARNEYLLTLEATNASVFKYYIHDLPDIIDVSNSSCLHLFFPSRMRDEWLRNWRLSYASLTPQNVTLCSAEL